MLRISKRECVAKSIYAVMFWGSKIERFGIYFFVTQKRQYTGSKFEDIFITILFQLFYKYGHCSF